MSFNKKWFVIVNPTSGNGSCKKLWPKINNLLIKEGFDFEYAFTLYHKHSMVLIENAVNQGFKNIICVGGDGTFHNSINGLMSLKKTNIRNITLGIIPVGTGNDWIRTYDIPKNIEKAIQKIKNGRIKQQDVGLISFKSQDHSSVYFNNLAGIGFDGYVVKTVNKYKRFGALAYIIGAVLGLFSFNNFNTTVFVDGQKFSARSLMVLIGICKYSGGGMRLTKEVDPSDGLFDISVAKDFSKLEIIKNLMNLFNGKIVLNKKVRTFKSSEIKVDVNNNEILHVQADGELVGVGSFEISIIPKAISFYC